MLSVKQAADALGVSRSLIYDLCALKRIRHERIGVGRGTIRIPQEAIEEYRRTRTVEVAEVTSTVRPHARRSNCDIWTFR